MSFSNTQLTKKHVITIITNSQKIIKYVIFKYAINKKYVIMFLYNILIYDIF